jgi:hypothetical protein
MKITKRQLRQLILKEFKIMDFDTPKKFDITAPPIKPPVTPPRRRGGGGEDGEPYDFTPDKNPGRCEMGNPIYEEIYDDVYYGFPDWLSNSIYQNFDAYLDYLMNIGVVLSDLSDNRNEFVKMFYRAVADYACKYNISNLELIYMDPRNAIGDGEEDL